MRKSFTREVMHLNKETLDNVAAIFQKTSLAVELKLHLGLCDYDDMACMRDMYNVCTASIALRGHTFDPEFTEEARKAIIEEGFNAWHEVYTRGKESDHYICNADQLKKIRRSFEFIDAIIDHSMRECPMTLMREWFGVRRLMKQFNGGKFHVTMKALKTAVSEACIDSVSAQYLITKYNLRLVPNARLAHTQELK